MTPDQLAAGVAALKQFVDQTKGFFDEMAIPESVYENGVTEIANTSNEVDGGQALFNSITAAGYGSDVTIDQCNAAAAVVLLAINQPGEST